MMMGHGSHIHGGSSPCSSTLSPLAPPFTAAASGPKPVKTPLLVDLKEPNYFVSINPSLHNWASHGSQPHNSSPDYFSVPTSDLGTIPSSNAYGYSPSNTHVTSPNPLVSAASDAAFFGKSSVGLVEAEPYYSSYVSPTIGDDSQLFAPQQSGYDLLSSQHVPATNELSRHDYGQNFSCLGHVNHWDGGSGWWEGLTNWQQSEPVKLDEGYCLKGSYKHQGTETCRESRSTGNDYKSFRDGNLEFFPSTCSTTSALESAKVILDTHAQPPPLKAVNSRNQNIPPFTSYDKCTRDDGNSNDSKAVTRSLPAVVVSVPVQDSFSRKNTNGGDDKDFVGSSSVGKDPQPFKGSESIVCFDANQLSFHPGQSDCILEFSGCNSPALDSLEQIFVATTETKSSGTNLACSNSSGFCSKAINSVENYPESLDSYNHAVDSPCWKGAPISQWCQFQVSEVVTPQNMKMHESCIGTNDQDSPSFPFASKDAVKFSPEKEGEEAVPFFDRSLEFSVGSSFKKQPVADMLFIEGTNDDMKSGQQLTRPECCHGIQISDNIHEPWEGNVLSNKSTHNCGFNPSQAQSLDEEKRTPDKNCAPRLDVAGDGKKINDEADGCSTHVPFLSVEHLLCPHPSAGDALSKLTKPLEPMAKGYAQILVNIMYNLSESLQFHLSNDACELKEEDCDLLMNVINNLNTCILKKMKRKGPRQESIVVPQSINSLARSPKLDKPQVLRVDAAKCPDELECLQQVQDKEHNSTHAKNEKFANFAPAMATADVVREDMMTQAIKKVLTENFQDEEETQPQLLFYKNLWLEAEASLCLVNSMARFNRMKIEMGNCHVSTANELADNTVVMENVPRSKVTSDPSPTRIEAGNKDGPLSDSSTPDSSVSATSGHADDVMDRFHILKARVDNLCTENTSVAEKLSGTKLLTKGQTDKLAHEKMDTAAKQETPNHDIVMSGTRSFVDDVEASVMARFHILRCRVDHSRSVDMETHQLEGIDFGIAGLRMVSPSSKHGSEDNILDVNMESVRPISVSNSDTDKSVVKEIHLFVNDDPAAQSCMTYGLGDHPCSSRCNSASSDWEHILKDEFTCKNC